MEKNKANFFFVNTRGSEQARRGEKRDGKKRGKKEQKGIGYSYKKKERRKRRGCTHTQSVAHHIMMFRHEVGLPTHVGSPPAHSYLPYTLHHSAGALLLAFDIDCITV